MSAFDFHCAAGVRQLRPVDHLQSLDRVNAALCHRRLRQRRRSGDASPTAEIKIRAIKNGRYIGQDQARLNPGPGADATTTRAAATPRSPRGRLHHLDDRDFTSIWNLHTGRWEPPDLAVRVTPYLAIEYADDTVDAIKLILLVNPILAGTVELMVWLMHRTVTQTFPGAQAVVLDVRRGRPYAALPFHRHDQTWSEAEARCLAYLHAHVAA